MPPALAYLSRRFLPASRGDRHTLGVALVVCLHLAALGILIWSEIDFVARIVFVLTWGLVNFTFLIVLRRPAIAAALTLMLAVILILLSRFKHDILMMTVNVLDIMIIDTDTIAFLLTVFPHL